MSLWAKTEKMKDFNFFSNTKTIFFLGLSNKNHLFGNPKAQPFRLKKSFRLFRASLFLATLFSFHLILRNRDLFDSKNLKDLPPPFQFLQQEENESDSFLISFPSFRLPYVADCLRYHHLTYHVHDGVCFGFIDHNIYDTGSLKGRKKNTKKGIIFGFWNLKKKEENFLLPFPRSL